MDFEYIIMTAALLLNIFFLTQSRLAVCINIIVIQNILMAILPLVSGGTEIFHLLIVSIITGIVKCIFFPVVLKYALRKADIQHEVSPLLNYPSSLLFGIILLFLSFWISSKLSTGQFEIFYTVMASAFSMILTGLFIIITRRNALNQVLGYIMLENGIYSFGVTMLPGNHLFIELGILLDIFAAVFIMGIIIFHIKTEFDHIEIDGLSYLKDWDKKGKTETVE